MPKKKAVEVNKVAEEVDAKVQKEVDKFFDEKPTPDIDHPPKEPKPGKEKQVDLIPPDTDEEKAEKYSPRYEVQVALKIKGTNGQPYSVPIMSGEFPRDRIKECLELNINSARFINVLNAITGYDPEKEQDEKQKANDKKEAENKTKKADKKGTAKNTEPTKGAKGSTKKTETEKKGTSKTKGGKSK